jgi:threonine 3-dehydrogenase
LTKAPITTGHEVCGEVVEVGSDVSDFKIGDLVSAESHLPCKSQKSRMNLKMCSMCEMGNEHIWCVSFIA